MCGTCGGLLAVELGLLWLTFGGAYYLALRRGADCADAALVTMAGALLGSFSFGPRMFHFGWLCLMAVMLILDRFERTGSGVWLLPVVFAVLGQPARFLGLRLCCFGDLYGLRPQGLAWEQHRH